MSERYNCKNCMYSVDYGDSVEYIYCEINKRKRTTPKDFVCGNFKSKEAKQNEAGDV